MFSVITTTTIWPLTKSRYFNLQLQKLFGINFNRMCPSVTRLTILAINQLNAQNLPL